MRGLSVRTRQKLARVGDRPPVPLKLTAPSKDELREQTAALVANATVPVTRLPAPRRRRGVRSL